jgi:hypothetical protein
MLSNYAVLSLLALILLYCVNQTRIYFRLNQYRGPRTSGLSRLWLLRANLSGRMHEYFRGVNDKYGELSHL